MANSIQVEKVIIYCLIYQSLLISQAMAISPLYKLLLILFHQTISTGFVSMSKVAYIGIYRCEFAGLQDTLWDDQGRHYFKKCTIQGAVDFIFGGGQSIYEDCAIQVLGDGYITAQGRTNPNDSNGFVFKRCNIFGNGSTYLGKPWRAYSRVLFHGSKFSNVIDPRGWDAWKFVGHEDKITSAEYGKYGPGAGTSIRVRWEKKLSPRNLNQLTNMSFIENENWIQEQPI